MNNTDKLALFDYATEFTFLPTGTVSGQDWDNLRNFVIEVTHASDGSWMIWTAAHEAWDETEQKWYHSLLPELREEPVKSLTRYEFDEAISLAYKLRDTVKVNGLTYHQWQEFFANRT
ncbi:MAG: hypothetical protein H9W81_08385 [Enterococcus sp.]|nr:hypothetical protein [Enterococcus sp.]